MSLNEAQNKFVELLRGLSTENEKNKFLKWIYDNWNPGSLSDHNHSCQMILDNIAAEIRSMVPFEAILPTEQIKMPICGPNSDCESKTTQHVDEFLYDDKTIDELVENGLISRYYCGDCFSRNTKLLTFISHSMSINRIQYLFRYLLPPLKNKTVLDVGSRLGPVLFGAYVYTSSPKIVGVEINPEFCDIQNEIVKKYNFSDRIKIICNSVFNEIEELSSADVVVLNNVFEFFTDISNSIASWHLLAQHIKPGCILVTVPHLSETFQHVKVDFDWEEWVEELKPFQEDNYDCDDEENHQQIIKHYLVKKKLN